MSDFKVISDFKPKGDQPNAIKNLAKNLDNGLLNQTLLDDTFSSPLNIVSSYSHLLYSIRVYRFH